MCLNPSDGVFGCFDLAALCGCHTLNACCFMLCYSSGRSSQGNGSSNQQTQRRHPQLEQQEGQQQPSPVAAGRGSSSNNNNNKHLRLAGWLSARAMTASSSGSSSGRLHRIEYSSGRLKQQGLGKAAEAAADTASIPSAREAASTITSRSRRQSTAYSSGRSSHSGQ